MRGNVTYNLILIYLHNHVRECDIKVNIDIFTDVRECDVNKGGCSDTCTELQGSYKCECPNGKALIESNGFEGYTFPTGETGLREGDVFYINHTCVGE